MTLLAIPLLLFLSLLDIFHAIRRKWFRVAIITSLLVLLNFLSFSFATRRVHGQTDKSLPDVRIMSFNMSLNPLERYTKERINKFICLVEEYEPDILCLQECSIESTPDIELVLDSIFGYSKEESLARLAIRDGIYTSMNVRDSKHLKCDEFPDIDRLESTIKDDALHKMEKTSSSKTTVELAPNKDIYVYSCHLYSNSYSTARRSMDKDDNWIKGIPLYYKNFRQGTMVRNWEAENLRADIESIHDNDCPVIVAGDFNDLSGSRTLRTIQGKDLKDAWWKGGFGFGFTYFGWNLRLRIDHILYNDKLELVNVFIPKTDLSDHRPIVADFRFVD